MSTARGGTTGWFLRLPCMSSFTLRAFASRTAFVASLALLVAACGDADASEGRTSSEPARSDPPVSISDPPAPEAKPTAVRIVEQDALVDFTYAWPAEATAVDAIDERFREEARSAEAELRRIAGEERTARAERGDTFNGLYGSTEWESAGRSDRLLSLLASVSSYTGGAHPNSGTATLLWDLKADKEIPIRLLFGKNAKLKDALKAPFCAQLEEMRAEKRGDMKIDGMFGECPDLASEVSVVPTDRDGNGLFERFTLVADPYVAGPYAEGEYRMEIPVDAVIFSALAPEYAGSFESAG